MAMIKTSCEDTGHCSDSARECNAPLHLPRHDPENETWDHNEEQDPDDEQSHLRLCPAEVGSIPLVIAILWVLGRIVGWMLVAILRNGMGVGIVGLLDLTGVLGFRVVVQVLERKLLRRRLVTAGFYCGSVWRAVYT